MRQIIITATALLLATSVAQAEIDFQPLVDGMIVSDDLAALPAPVRAKRQQLIDATLTANPESLRAIVAAQAIPTQFASLSDDPVAGFVENSDDPEGRQMLAIVRNLLEMPYAVLSPNTADARYVWPYLANVDFEKLTPQGTVDAYRLLTPDLVEGSREFGGWYWWRISMNQNGDWLELLNGD